MTIIVVCHLFVSRHLSSSYYDLAAVSLSYSVICFTKLLVFQNFCEKMADKQFDLSPAKQQVLIEKAKRRETLRSEFLKLSTDPARHASNEGGYVVSYLSILCNALRTVIIICIVI